ncbi:MAG: arylsulfatase [Marinifilaceae bacterium]
MKKQLLTSVCLMPIVAMSVQAKKNQDKPNVIYILADDMGIGDLGCYGQPVIKTPALDRLAAQGIRFEQHYSGSTVSAPSRCALLTGKHTGNATIRGNGSKKDLDGYNYDSPLKQDDVTVAEIMKRHDYRTACFGKWGLGGPSSVSHPNKKGFDYFYGYLGQGLAHSYYPEFLHENNEKVQLERKRYSHDLIVDKTLDFISQSGKQPFFIYFSPTIPHAELILPEGELGDYDGKFEEPKPFKGGHYCAQPKPRTTYAAMVTRLDSDIQRIVDLLKEQGIYENTIILFASDNGVHREGGCDPDFFNSNGNFRGYKRDLYEGGIRTPHIVHWPAKIKSARVSNHISAFWDFLPTMCDLVGEKAPEGTNGISYLPTLMGKKKQNTHSHLYFEFHEMGGKQAVIKNQYKLIKLNVNKPEATRFELYNLATDPTESTDLAQKEPQKVKELMPLLTSSRTKNAQFMFREERIK